MMPPLVWRPDLAPTIAIVATATAYAAGVRRAWAHAGRGRGIRVAQVAAVATGMSILAVALMSPLDAMSEELFAAHMTQHVLLAVAAPPFLVTGGLLLGVFWALPLRARKSVVSLVHGTAWLQRVWLVLSTPAIAWFIHMVAIWSWHVPTLYELALRSGAAHALEHFCFVGSAMLLWWTIIHPREQRRTAYAIGILSIFATAMHTGVLGALITFSHRVWYPAQAAGVAAWGLTPLEDQQLAGLIMWVPAGLLYVAAMSALFVAWLGSARRGRVAIACAIGVAASSCGHPDASVVPGGSIDRGRQSIAAFGCGSCHTISGVPNASGEVGPPLDGVARRSIIAGQLANTPDNMMRWIEDPQAVEPNTAMPNLHVTPQAARDIVAYLYSLR